MNIPANLLAAAGLLLGAAAFAQVADMTDGEVRKVDKAQSKITLKHGEIKKLEMPPMTMVFRVKDAKLLDGVAQGDKVSFTAEQIDGQIVVTALQKKP
jgi:Cu/Ag efflux protein CusF